jgi:stage V sporulation protein B
VLIAATVQVVSKHVSEDDARAPAALRQGLVLQAGIATVLASIFVLFAPALAGWFHQERLVPLLRLTAVVIFSYSIYAALVGSLNGRRLFQRQAALDVTFSTLRTIGVLGGAALGLGALGAIGGFAGAAAIILLVALVVVGIGRRGEGFPWSRWIAFVAPIWVYQTFVNVMLQGDLWLVQRVVAELAMERGLSEAAAGDEASGYVGYYRAAQTFAFVPYQLLIAVTFVVFPMVSRATAVGDLETTRGYIRSAMRFSVLAVLALAAPVAGAAAGVMQLVYPVEYLAGAGALGVLVFGIAAFALFVISATVLSGARQPLKSAVIAAIGLCTGLGATWVLLHRAGLGDGTLIAAATGTTIGSTVAMVLAGAEVWRTFRAFLPIATAVRVGIAGTAAFVVAHLVPVAGRISALGALVAGFAAYVIVLVILRELRGADFDVVRRILKRGRG